VSKGSKLPIEGHNRRTRFDAKQSDLNFHTGFNLTLTNPANLLSRSLLSSFCRSIRTRKLSYPTA
jgi:hypothetical protein